ncbi:pilus assembly protein [Novosphingobium sp.]|uniref:TadE/TadG family type IV pilus assembly protein n=1 Tax=Novosphingobium sp. TaxID=1874826 RepID=UPI00286A3D60|nr:pilus assembly protein [Novosphingobium sp.]
MVEFALGAPFLLMAGLWGIELANYALVTMKVNQLAIHVADNASRIGDSATLQDRKIFEEDVNDLLLGANIQAGKGLNLYQRGRVIVSSYEIWKPDNHKANGVVTTGGTPYIAWQRCKGVKPIKSDYGVQNSAMKKGLGPAGEEVYPEPETPIIFVEITYDYQPIFSTGFISSTTIKSYSSFVVRDVRDQWDIYKRNAGTPIADCKIYDTFT